MRDRLDDMIVDLRRLSGSARVGALDEETARKLSYSEFGTPTAEPRPTLSRTTDRLARPIERAVQRRVVDVLDGRGRGTTGQEVCADVARDLAEEVRDAIDGDTRPALAASTLAARRRRGQGDRTLVASGEMLRGIGAETSANPDAWDE